MVRPTLNIDVGEHADEPRELIRVADRVNVACGGHAGDAASMRQAVRHAAGGPAVGAHPSYVDRAGFGRVALQVEPEVLRRQIHAQCAALASVAAELGVPVVHVKPHGALYHRAAADPAVAAVVIGGAVEALGDIAVIGPPTGALADEAARRGLPYLREGFADRGLRPDGSLLPRGASGALLQDPEAAAAQALTLAASGRYDTFCVHGDTPRALEIATRVRAALASFARGAAGGPGEPGAPR